MNCSDTTYLAWSHGSFVTHRLGGMTAPITFNISEGAPFSPFSEPPWNASALPASIPGHVRGLRGVFPCLPFGISCIPRNAPSEWRKCDNGGRNPVHGPGANGLWRFGAECADGVHLSFDHAEDDAIATSSQTIAPTPGRPIVAFTYSALPRRSLRMPFGYHLMLKWNDDVRLDPGPFTHGLCYPGTLDPGLMMTVPNSSFTALDDVPGKDGRLCMTQPNWAGPSEDVVMLCGTQGRFRVSYPSQRCRLDITWDAAVMPNCLLWYSRYGIAEEPWCNRYSAIGIEPIAAAFDLLPDVSAHPNPLTEIGVVTSLALSKGVAFSATLVLEASVT